MNNPSAKRKHASQPRHLLGIEGMTAAEITNILSAARVMKYKTAFTGMDIKSEEWIAPKFRTHASLNPKLKGFGNPLKQKTGGMWSAREAEKGIPLKDVTVATLFFENSTRTRSSFELAARMLGANVISFVSGSSSMAKGESVYDTARTIEAMGVNIAVVRHSCAGVPRQLTSVINASIINAGDGAHEHPTQALLDGFTIHERLGGIKGLRVCIVGDIANSRVARSNIFLLKTMGATVVVCGPRTLMPRDMEKALGVEVDCDMPTAIAKSDVVIMLRIQSERQAAGKVPTLGEYRNLYGIGGRLPENVRLVLHPGPVNRGVEMSSEAMDSQRSAVTQQVSNGVFIRMAALALLGVKK